MTVHCVRPLKTNPLALRFVPCRRLDKLFESGLDDVLRSKGLLWVAGIHASSLIYNQAGEHRLPL